MTTVVQHIDFIPRGGAKALLYCQDPEALIAGPAGTGKSFACAWKCFLAAADHPGARVLIVRKTRASCTESVLVTLESIMEGLGISDGADRRNRQSYKLPNGSVIVVGGMDNADRILSTEFDLIWAAEATEFDESDLDILTTRLRHTKMPFTQLIADCNPSAPSHPLYMRCLSGRMKMIDSAHTDNPLLWDGTGWTAMGADYIAKLDSLTGVLKERLRFGKWVAAEGVVYTDWDTRRHVVDSFAIPSDWRRIRTIDWGYVCPAVCLWIACDPDGAVYVYRQLFRTSAIVPDFVREILAFDDGPVEVTVADHDATDRATAAVNGLYTIAARKDIKPGIEAVAQRLAAGRLFVFRDSLVGIDGALQERRHPYCLEQEFDSYAWPNAGTIAATREVPVKQHDHGLDALRYAVVYIDGLLASAALTAQWMKDRKRRCRLPSRREQLRAV